MPQLNAYLTFDGNCAEAMQFYQRTLGGALHAMTVADSPMADQMPPGSAERIVHARLDGGGFTLMASDSMGGEPFIGMKGCALALAYPTAPEAQAMFDALADGGQVTLPMQKMFWADAFGMLNDRYGTPWLINGNLQAPAGAHQGAE